jgi:hypothetical protein
VAKKKKNKGKPPAPTPLSPPRFAGGDRVRVVAAGLHPKYPDIPWGGWAGVVEEVDEDKRGRFYSVRWSPETLAAAHPVYFRRCQRDETKPDLAWMSEDELEPDPGTPLAIEQPTHLVPPPLDVNNPADLARHVLGVSSDEDLPPLTPDGLVRFHAFLQQRARGAQVVVDEGGMGRVEDAKPGMVRGVQPLTPEMSAWDVLVDVRLLGGEEVQKPITDILALPDRDSVALAAYHEWLQHAEESAAPKRGGRSLQSFLVEGAALAGLMGAVLFSLLQALPGTHLAAQIGACLLGFLGGLMGGNGERQLRQERGLRTNVVGGGLLGLLAGAFLGATLGAVLIAGLGALLGAVAGLLLKGVLSALGVRWPGVLRLAILGVAAGAIWWAFRRDAEQALAGLWRGALGGLAIGAILFGGSWVYFRMVAPMAGSNDEGESDKSPL